MVSHLTSRSVKKKKKKQQQKTPKPQETDMIAISRFVWNHKKPNSQDFPGGPVVKNLPATGDMGLVPGSGRFHKPWDSLAHVPQLPKTAGPRADAVQ